MPVSSNEKQLPDNCTKIKSNTYYVRTQAGFNKALKDYQGSNHDKLSLVGFPTAYPALVIFSLSYAGYEYIQVTSLYLSDIKKILDSEQQAQQILKANQ